MIPVALLAVTLAFEPHELKSFDGRTRSVELGRLQAPDGIRVGFYRLKAKRQPPGAVPTVFLMGGPGVPGTVIAQVPPYFDLFDKLSENADVIVLDQRGLGTGSPRLDCPPPPGDIPPDFLGSLDRLRRTYVDMTAACAGHWRSQGVDPRAYTITAVADDLAGLRGALRVPKIDLLAFSYGTRIALEAIRRHPGLVRRAVFQGTNGPDQTIKLPSDFEALLRAIAPDLENRLRDTVEALHREPARVSVRNANGAELQLPIGAEPYANLVALRLGDRRTPALIRSTASGDTRLLARVVESLYRDFEKGAGNLMARSVVCSAPASVTRAQQARREAASSLFGEIFDTYLQTSAFCEFTRLGPERPAPSTPVRSPVPALFLTGTLDDRTPPRNAAEVARGFPHAVQVIVENGPHELLPVPSVQDLVAKFLSGSRVSAEHLKLPRPEYPALEQALREWASPRR